jgi:hypothetical protein
MKVSPAAVVSTASTLYGRSKKPLPHGKPRVSHDGKGIKIVINAIDYVKKPLKHV